MPELQGWGCTPGPTCTGRPGRDTKAGEFSFWKQIDLYYRLQGKRNLQPLTEGCQRGRPGTESCPYGFGRKIICNEKPLDVSRKQWDTAPPQLCSSPLLPRSPSSSPGEHGAPHGSARPAGQGPRCMAPGRAHSLLSTLSLTPAKAVLAAHCLGSVPALPLTPAGWPQEQLGLCLPISCSRAWEQ